MPPASEPGSSLGSTSTSLLERVKTQDQEAWRRLVRLYGPLVDYWIRRSSVQAADAEDIFQETFRAVARSIGTFHKDQAHGSFRRWLRSITRSKLIDHHRRLGHEPQGIGGSDVQLQWQELAEDAESDAGEAQEIDTLRLRALELVRAEFEDRTWQMFWRVAVEGHEVKDVARDLGVTTSAVRLAKSRVLRRLREQMEGLEP
jgi:RNA polymerase sigma-70 factor (ECF subfamily)